MTFDQAIQTMPVVKTYNFGTDPDRNVTNLESLAQNFHSFGAAGRKVINQEWERYQPFNSTNFVFRPRALNITANIPEGGGLFPGGINSGQIWTTDTFQPGLAGKVVYAFEVRMRIPARLGTWPAARLVTKIPAVGDNSEIVNPQFLEMLGQYDMDWISAASGPGAGPELYSIQSNPWNWHPGLKFSGDYHDFQTLWTTDMVYSYVDGTLVRAQAFKWTSGGEAQFGIDLAVGSDAPNLAGLTPTSLAEFPAVLSIDHLKIWAQ